MFNFTLSERCFVAGQICRKFTHFPSVKFPGLKMCACKKNDKYQVWCSDVLPPPWKDISSQTLLDDTYHWLCSQYNRHTCNGQQSSHTSPDLNSRAQPIFSYLFDKTKVTLRVKSNGSITWLAQPLGSHCPGLPSGNRFFVPHFPLESQGFPGQHNSYLIILNNRRSEKRLCCD